MEKGHLAATVAHMVNLSAKAGKTVSWDKNDRKVVS
jgi:hypothetical protein